MLNKKGDNDDIYAHWYIYPFQLIGCGRECKKIGRDMNLTG